MNRAIFALPLVALACGASVDVTSPPCDAGVDAPADSGPPPQTIDPPPYCWVHHPSACIVCEGRNLEHFIVANVYPPLDRCPVRIVDTGTGRFVYCCNDAGAPPMDAAVDATDADPELCDPTAPPGGFKACDGGTP